MTNTVVVTMLLLLLLLVKDPVMLLPRVMQKEMVVAHAGWPVTVTKDWLGH